MPIDYSKFNGIGDSSSSEDEGAAAPAPTKHNPWAARLQSDGKRVCDGAGCGKLATIGPCRVCHHAYCSRECEFAPFLNCERRCPGIIEMRTGGGGGGGKGGVRHHADTLWKSCDVTSQAALDAEQRECARVDDAIREGWRKFDNKEDY